MNGFSKKLLVLAILVSLCLHAKGQETICKWVKITSDSVSVQLDSLTVLESSIQVKHPDNILQKYQISSGNLILQHFENQFPDSVEVCYQRFSFSLHQNFSNRTLKDHYDSMAFFDDKRERVGEVFDFREEIFPSDKLHKTGNLTRGISFGNTQNVFVNSSLNLQMEGELTDDLFINASITDQNVPFQPEGNTQQLQDFDNVLINLYNDQFNLSAGDVVFQQRKSSFLRYYKNVQGLQLTTDYEINEKWKASSQLGASIAKGKFASVSLEVLEGVLGPYRIQGPGQERFVIIMANSEKVYLDGQLLKRGFNYDYVIDYNQGEITFTTNVLITQYSRVRVDYEYAERNFSRSILMANHIQKSDKASFYVNYYKEQDNKNRPLFYDLEDEEKQLLASVGDSLNAAAVPQVDSLAYDDKRILYRKIQEGDQAYFEYSTDPEEAHFEVKFSKVGQGNGHYQRKEQLANGVVYEYVPPVNGVPQGNYSINAPLPAPNKKQMITAGGELELGKYESWYAEMAFSDKDLNLFSKLASQDDKGFAIKSGIKSEGRKITWLKCYTLHAQTEWEYNSPHFSFIDRMRYIEFDRDWGVGASQVSGPGRERLGMAKVEVQKDSHNLASYQANLRNRGEVLQGMQHRAKLHQQLGNRIFTQQSFFVLNSQGRGLDTDWLRYQGDWKYVSKIFVPGIKVEIDKNVNQNAETDSVVSTAMNFREHQFYLRSNDSLSYSFFANASWREDRFPVSGQMVPATKAFTTKYGWEKAWGSHDLKGTFTYRKLEHLSRELPQESTVMGRMDYKNSLWNHNVRNELTYAIGNGRELKREFVYLPVPTGEGTHTWRDDNEDGIQQLNEFYLAINPEEKNFIKVFTPTDEYIQAYTTMFNYRLNASFPDNWSKGKGFKKFLSRFSNTTSWNVEKKITASDFWKRMSPVSKGVADKELISLREILRSTFFFNRSSAQYGFDLSLFNSTSKQLLTGGFEEAGQKDWKLNTRVNFNAQWNLRLSVENGERSAASDFLNNRNYQIDQWKMGPELTWQPTSFFRTGTSYNFSHKINLANENFKENARLHQLVWELRYAKAIKTTINALLKYTQIEYNGEPNSPVGYEMLEALTIGSNISWSINWIQKIGEGLQLNLSYEGRDSEGLNRLVHTGRMQVSALF
ncbi:hypothetical protein QWY93_10540 [Echinicola jeungdonensis]|uniref:Uncharacterized protein n=1 Tax=Echinicola jeungdonensis TaxID=709343 RepID=A0ABV5J7H1_9BACT|nr:hypothetical protein [Echinicola jeungdonensis]MDN3669760.1 hypothetical protein [Echinicola jeungdonensis]